MTSTVSLVAAGAGWRSAITRSGASFVSSASRTSGFDGIRKLNVDPLPSVLSTEISPPIISQNRRLIARPSPVPPYCRVVEASTCVKSWNSRSICSAVMPMPVSLTRKCIQSRPLDTDA